MDTTATLTRMAIIAEDTYELTFTLDQPISFAAGQYCRVGLPHFTDPTEKRSRKFTMVNAPHQNTILTIATRAGVSAYKRALLTLAPGAHVEIFNIKGTLVLPQQLPRPVVFIAGGIGITPFISMLRDMQHRDAFANVTLLYFNRTLESAAYLTELQEMHRQHKNLTLILSMTRQPTWGGETQRLSTSLLEQLLCDLRSYDYFVVGTPAMVEATLESLRAGGVDSSHIFDEDFSGYARTS